MNTVNLLGRLTDDPEVKVTQSGASVLSFRIAVNRPAAKDKEREADFINCVAWRSTAEFINKYFVKGSQIAVTGTLRTRQYTDGRHSDVTHYATEVQVKEAFFAGSSAAQNSRRSYAKSESDKSSASSPAVSTVLDDFEEIITDDSVPF